MKYKFNKTTIKNPAYNKYLLWQKDKPLFNTFNILACDNLPIISILSYSALELILLYSYLFY